MPGETHREHLGVGIHHLHQKAKFAAFFVLMSGQDVVAFGVGTQVIEFGLVQGAQIGKVVGSGQTDAALQR